MSIKVAVRVRPFNAREKEKQSICVIGMQGQATTIKDDNGVDKTFSFDNSFWSHDGFTIEENGYFTPDPGSNYSDQTQVFNALGKEILDNAWQGYHCCLFAYGQTGSGKSYSMVGYGANKGIVPISCEEIFTRIKNNTNLSIKFEVEVSMLEIYNEKVQDLLCPTSKRPPNGLKVRESKTLGIFVEGLTKHPVQSYQEISNKMDDGYENRTIGSTLMNATSSRAHTIVTIEFKQVQTVGTTKSEKLSMINLVDLAGSERAGSTGATGDRLKEGCNINKSLLVLGNVINTLADKATGKRKDVLPPYRDSALTRILQNALGGNSKTVMICALSPASINYEETLGTLRYADRAKKIQNKAVVNESEHDKTVRLLKEENNDLKKKIEELSVKLLGNGGVVEDEDKEAFSELKAQYDANQKVFENMQKTFDERVEEAKSKEKEIGQKVDSTKPHLVVLNEDPQLSHKLKYSLKELPVYVGRKHGNPQPKIILSGIGIKQNHAIFVTNDLDKDKDKDKNEIIIKANDPEAKDYIFVNGKKLTTPEGIVLKQKDRITFGTNTIMLFLYSSDGKEFFETDWENAQMELQNEIEEANRCAYDQLKQSLEEKFTKEKKDIEDKVKAQLQDYESKLKEMNETVEKNKMEKEREKVEAMAKQRIEFLESEKTKKKREYEQRRNVNNEIVKGDQSKDQQQKSDKLDNTLLTIYKKVDKFRSIISELKRNVEISVFLTKNLLDQFDDPLTPVLIFIRVENYEIGTVYYWTSETFYNKYDLMKDLYYKYLDEDYDIFNLKNEADPLWDEAKPSLLGYAFYKLEPVAYLMSNLCTISIINVNGDISGALTVDVIPHDLEGKEFDDIPEQASSLVGTALYFKVYIKECKDLPEYFCRGVQVEYISFHDNMNYKTKVYNEKEKEKDTSFAIEESFEHRLDYITQDDMEFLLQDKLCFKIYAYEEVEVKGKNPRPEKIRREVLDDFNLTQPQIINDAAPIGKSNGYSKTVANAKKLKKGKDCLIY